MKREEIAERLYAVQQADEGEPLFHKLEQQEITDLIDAAVELRRGAARGALAELILVMTLAFGIFMIGVHVGHREGSAHMRDTILCVTAHSMGHTYSEEARRQCSKLGTPITPLAKRKPK